MSPPFNNPLDKHTRAARIAARLEVVNEKLLKALAAAPEGLTFWPLCQAAGLSTIEAGPALTDLVKAGAVRTRRGQPAKGSGFRDEIYKLAEVR